MLLAERRQRSVGPCQPAATRHQAGGLAGWLAGWRATYLFSFYFLLAGGQLNSVLILQKNHFVNLIFNNYISLLRLCWEKFLLRLTTYDRYQYFSISLHHHPILLRLSTSQSSPAIQLSKAKPAIIASSVNQDIYKIKVAFAIHFQLLPGAPNC